MKRVEHTKKGVECQGEKAQEDLTKGMDTEGRILEPLGYGDHCEKAAMKWKHLQFRDDIKSIAKAGGPDFKSFRIADHLNIRGNFRNQWKRSFSSSWSVWSQSLSGSALNLSQLARLLSQTGISIDLRHKKGMFTNEIV